ncbi:glutamine--tRNA ligase/YqeY domain fusion protein [Myxococcota bacterium]|nr:glutamine--tRNA ligase/YqeY domain fusion protein [Myxococcota bacterium]
MKTIIEGDLETGKYGGRVATRFPPEPNGYLHIGHAKSICLNFGLARDYRGTCNLRFDDTNPTKEDVEYVRSIEEDVRWLGFEWDGLYHAADYFDAIYDFAVQLIKMGKAYVCDLTEEEVRKYRGTLTEPGKPSPGRARSIEENLDLFARMRAGEFPDGKYTLRAKIDMASPNLKMRDPPLYRIRHATHHRSGDKWCIYPLYDFTHCLSDSIERITHSICTLEFENNRELYDWFLIELGVYRPQQIEFARLNLSYTMMSKRKLLSLVEEKLVDGWDDPRMPTIAGFRRRGYTPEAIRAFCDRIGVARRDSLVDVQLLEYSIRDDLNTKVPRAMAVLRPLKVVVDNYPEGTVDELDVPNFPDDPPKMGARKVPFSKVLYIEKDDFMESPPKKYFRLAPGAEVRLRFAFLVRCTSVVKNDAGEVIEVHCTYDPESRGGTPADGRKVKGTIHWVSAAHAVDAEVRLYDHLFTAPEPGANEDVDWRTELNPKSREVVTAKLERSLGAAEAGSRFQFERQGFFFADPTDSKPGAPVFNRIVALRDGWAKIASKEAPAKE